MRANTGIAFSDLDADGMQDAGETALAGWTVFLDRDANGVLDEDETLIVTGEDGAYLFTGIGPRNIEVGQIAPSGWQRTTPTVPYAVRSGFAQVSDLGNVQLASLSGTKFKDSDGDGAFDVDETGIAGWTIFLDVNGNGMLDAGERSTTTDADGRYHFDDLLPGQYNVAEVQVGGWLQTTPLPAPQTVGISTAASNISLESLGCGCGGTWSSSSTGSTVDYGMIAIETALDTTGITNLRADHPDLDGHGQTVVVIDTGIDLDHAFFGADLDGNGVADRIAYQWDFGEGDPDATDVNGHGSHIASLIGSQDSRYYGVASGADLIALKVFDDSGYGTFAYLEQALQWVLANREAYNISVVNLSLGDGGNWTNAFSRYGIGDELAALAQTDVIVVAAAGNNYLQFGSMGVAYPASDPAAIAVGATWAADFGGPWMVYTGATNYSTGVDEIAAFSQRDDVLLDTFAPGARFNGANASGGIQTMQGTSQATAFVSGAAALTQQIAGDVLGRGLTTAEFATLLRQTGDLIVDGDDEIDNVPNTGLEFPRLNFVKLAEAIATLGTTPEGGSVGTGGTIGGTLVRQAAMGVHTVALTAGANVVSLDFGNFELGEISGIVFDDFDANGLNEAGDNGLDGWTVYLDRNTNGQLDVGESSTQTAGGGVYSFTGVGPGTHRVSVFDPGGWGYTTDSFFDVVMTSGASAARDFGVNQTPSVAGESFSGDEDTVISGDVSGNDNDPDGPTYTAQVVGDVAHGDLVLNANSSFSYTPVADWHGEDSFTYRVSDGVSQSETVTVSLTVHPVNDAPVADADNASGDEDTVLSGNVLVNDDDIDGDALTALLVDGPAHGTLTLNADGSFSYTSDTNFNGNDSFTYKANDGVADSNVATVSITVDPVNDKPTADPIANQSLNEGQTVTLTVIGHDDDGDPLGYSLISGPGGIDPVSGVYSFDTSDGYAVHNVGVRVSDGHVDSFFDVFFDITVNNVAPTLSLTGAATGQVGMDYSLTLGHSDPGDDTLTGWIIDWGDSTQSTYPGDATTASHVYAAAGTYGISASATDEDGVYDASGPSVTVEVAAPASFQVTAFEATASGFHLGFNRAFDASVLNLYSAADTPMGAADLTLVGAGTGAVKGSLVLDSDGLGARFIQTGGALAADSYSLTLSSRADGWRDQSGQLLDGNGDGSAGDDYHTSFSVAPLGTEVLVSLRDLVVGPGQSLNNGATRSQAIISLVNAAGLTGGHLELAYDSSLLDLNDATPITFLGVFHGSWSLDETTGHLHVDFTTAALGAGSHDVLRLNGLVPTTATGHYGGKQVLDLNAISLDGGRAARVDDGLQLNAYLGDTSFDASYTTLDTQRLQRVNVGLDSGFGGYRLADPRLIGDIDGNGLINVSDAQLLVREVKGGIYDRPEIANIPAGITGFDFGGADPLVDLPRDLQASAGGEIRVPVRLSALEPGLDSIPLEAVQLGLTWDATQLRLLGWERGGLTADFGLENIDQGAGRIEIDLSRLGGVTPVGLGELVWLRFQVAADAQGEARIDLQSARLNDSHLTLNPAPQVGADPTDGVIGLAPAQNPATVAPAASGNAAAVIDFAARYSGFEFKGNEKGWLGDWLGEGKEKKPNLEALRIQPKTQPKLAPKLSARA